MRAILFSCVFFLSAHSIFSQQQSPYEDIDRHAKHAPFWKKSNVKKLTAHLIEPCSTEQEKARAIYTWITRHVRYDVKRYSKQKLEPQSPKKTLWRRKALCGDYAALFNAMCKEAGLVSLQVIGYSSGADFENDDLYYNINHAWNAVKLDGEWYLLDATYGAGTIERVRGLKDYLRFLYTFRLLPTTKKFRRETDYFYFQTPPCLLIYDHLPSEQAFQLLDSTISLSDFEKVNIPNRCTENYFTEIIPKEGVSSAAVDMISSLPPTEYYQWEGDSAYTFNCRSILQQAIDYERTGTAWIDASTVKQGEQLSVEDRAGLEAALIFFDSCKKLLPEARVMSREEAYYRTQKNKYRNRLAKGDITRCAKHQRGVNAETANLKRRNRQKVKSLRKQNLLISERIEKINAINLDEVSVKNEPDPVEAGNIIAQNRKQIILDEDSIDQALLVLKELYQVMDEQLLKRMEELGAQIRVSMINITWKSQQCTQLRSYYDDDLDPVLQKCARERDSVIIVNAYYLGQKDSLRKQLLKVNDSSRVWVNRIRVFSTEVSKLLKENKKWGDAETYNLLEKLKAQVQQLELITRRNELCTEYLRKEIPWGKQVYRISRGIKRTLNEEGEYETLRYQEKNSIIQSRRRGLIKTASQVNRNASRQQRLVKKLLKI